MSLCVCVCVREGHREIERMEENKRDTVEDKGKESEKDIRF